MTSPSHKPALRRAGWSRSSQDSRSGPGRRPAAGRRSSPHLAATRRMKKRRKPAPGASIGSDSRHKGRADKGRQGAAPRRSRCRRHRHGRAGRTDRRAVRLAPRPRAALLKKPPRPAAGHEEKGRSRSACRSPSASLSEAIGMKAGELSASASSRTPASSTASTPRSTSTSPS